jgi:hypothetical protein
VIATGLWEKKKKTYAPAPRIGFTCYCALPGIARRPRLGRGGVLLSMLAFFADKTESVRERLDPYRCRRRRLAANATVDLQGPEVDSPALLHRGLIDRLQVRPHGTFPLKPPLRRGGDVEGAEAEPPAPQCRGLLGRLQTPRGVRRLLLLGERVGADGGSAANPRLSPLVRSCPAFVVGWCNTLSHY